MVERTNEEAQAIIAVWMNDPVSFVRHNFGAEPDAWQVDALISARDNPKTAMSACKGPGKSCVLAWIIWWFVFCHENAQVACVSITLDNLRANLWKEMEFWASKSKPILRAFDIGKKAITHKERGGFWWVQARSFAQNADKTAQANTLAGLHAPHVMFVLDEIGGYPPGVLPAAEAIFATEGQHARVVVAGNPETTQGPLYTIVSNPVGWFVIFITGDPDDVKRSPRIDIAWARAEIAKFGRDNPWVMVNILGLFPPGGTMQLIGANVVMRAMQRDISKLQFISDARIWGLDPSRFGDDEAVLLRRQGMLVRRVDGVWRNKTGTELGDIVASRIINAREAGEGPDAVFVDVGGVGASAFDRLIALGFEKCVFPIDFGSKASKDTLYLNKRAEMWCEAKDWLEKMPAVLPNDPVLSAELQGPMYELRSHNGHTVYQIESKEKMKKRGVPSPNRADALVLTFAAPVMPQSREVRDAEGPMAGVKKVRTQRARKKVA